MKTTVFKPDFNRRSVVAAAFALPLVALSGRAAQAAKMTQNAVAYQPTPKDGKKCSDCTLFVAPKACKSVDGDISPDGWCKIWVKKPS